jgi:heme-degrading monooxygenase HmoA
MAYLFVKHTVNDFGQWQTVYDSMADTKRAGGWLSGRIMRDSENPNQVVVLDEYATLEAAKTWAQNPALRVAMGHAGVIGKPEIAFLENVC